MPAARTMTVASDGMNQGIDCVLGLQRKRLAKTWRRSAACPGELNGESIAKVVSNLSKKKKVVSNVRPATVRDGRP